MKNARRIVQAGLLVLTLAGVFLLGSNAESWCPFGGIEAIEGTMTVGEIMAFVNYLRQTLFSLTMVSMLTGRSMLELACI